MPKKSNERLEATVDSLRPYVERALKDEDFREHVREALTTARGIYGDLSKERGLGKSARKLATDKDLQDNLRRALEELGDAADRVQVKGKKGRARRRVTRRCWSPASSWARSTTRGRGPTRHWLLEKIAGDDELAPLDVDGPEPSPVAAAVANGGESARGLAAAGWALARRRAVQSPLQPAGNEPARPRDVGHLEQHGAGRRRADTREPARHR